MSTTKLLCVNQVPKDLRVPFITSGYRSCRSSVATCIRSAFSLNNETFNFWTHFLSLCLFAWIFSQKLWSELRFDHDPFTYPLQVFLASVCLYMLVSCSAHLFNCMSERSHHIWFFFDYGAVGLYGLSCGIMYNTYVFPESLINSTFHTLYLPISVFNAMLSTFFACMARVISRKFIRILAFSTQYIFSSLPLLYRILFCESDDFHSNAVQFHIYQFILCAITVVIFGTHFPEVLAPGKFDIIGHSHQLFHVISALATYCQLQGNILDMQNRRSYLGSVLPMPTLANTAGVVLIVLVANVGIIFGFTALVWNEKHLRKIKLKHGILNIIQTFNKQCGE